MRYPPNMTLRPIAAWPGELTENRRRSQFSAPFADTLELLSRELRMLGKGNRTPDSVLQMALSEGDFRNDGMPRAAARPQHPGVIVSVFADDGELTFPCDTFLDWHDNVRAVALTLEALRKMNRYGVTRNDQQYRGWKAIGSGGSVAAYGAREAAMTVWRAAGYAEGLDADYVLDRLIGDSVLARRAVRKARGNSHPDANDGAVGGWNTVETAVGVLRAAGVVVS